MVPLCVQEPLTHRAVALQKVYNKVVWWSAPVEIASALARLGRMKQLQPAELARARQLAQDLADFWSVIQPSDALRTEAAKLVGRCDLRAAELLAASRGLGVVPAPSEWPRLSHCRSEIAGSSTVLRLRR
jgi:hypothetical protein